jgi:hypothetical protein
MPKGRLGERLRGDTGTTAEFDCQGGGALAMRGFGGMVEAHRINTIRRCERRRVKVQMIV